jgi:predicted GNAT family N-acyltransferase
MDDQKMTLRWAGDQVDIDGAFAIRERVFCGEQGVPRELELDGRDREALHLLARSDDGEPVGTLRLLLDGERAKVGRVAVEASWRRRGIATLMLQEALDLARGRGCAEARLAAQVATVGLYERAGFTVQSEPFLEAGIEHVWMGQSLIEL